MYFLAIVNEANLRQGLIVPAYFLCQSKGKSKNRSNMRVQNVVTGQRVVRLPKVLVDKPYGHDELVMYLSNYRTREHMHRGKYKHKATMKYFPKGALFWFPCDRYGAINGDPIFIKRVPDKSAPYEREALEFLRNSDKEYLYNKSINKLQEDYLIDLTYSDKKVVFPKSNFNTKRKHKKRKK